MRKYTWQALVMRKALEENKMSQKDANYIIFGHRRQGQIVSNWCRGTQAIPVKHLPKIFKELGVSREDMIEAKLKDERDYLDKISHL